MRVTKLSFTNTDHDNSTIEFPIEGITPSSRFILKNVVGSGPPDLDIMQKKSRYGGGHHELTLPQSRQMVFRILLNPNRSIGESVDSLRAELYNNILGTDGRFFIRAHTPDVHPDIAYIETQGWVSKFETAPFNKEAEVQITADCPSPYFWAENAMELEGEFDIWPEIRIQGLLVFQNEGSAKYGFDLEFTIDVGFASTNINILDSWYREINLQGVPTAVGDRIVLHMNYDEREVFLYKGSDGSYKQLTEYMTPNSEWLYVYPGRNSIKVEMQNANTGNYVPHFSNPMLNYLPHFWGF